MRNATLCLFHAAWLISACSCDVALAEPMSADLAKLFKARRQQLQNMTVVYDLTEEAIVSPQRRAQMASEWKTDDGKSLQLIEKVHYQCTWSILGDRVRLEQLPAKESGSALPMTTFPVTRTVNGQRQESLFRGPFDKSVPVQGALQAKTRYPQALIDVAFGLRLHSADMLLTDDELVAFDVRSIDENVVVLAKADGERTHLLTYDRKLGLALMRYEVLHSGKPNIDWTMSQFAASNSVWYPQRCDAHYQVEGVTTARKALQLSSAVFGSPENKAENYAIVFPENTPVVDTRIEQQFGTCQRL